MSEISFEAVKMSASLKELGTALAKAQAVMQPAAKDAANPFFKSKYADLPSVWDAIREPLTKNGLSVVQLPTNAEPGRVGLSTMLLHASGEFILSVASMKLVKDDPQGAGSGLTYLRRYMLAAAVGVVADEDDDANAATHRANNGSKQNGQPQRNGSLRPHQQDVSAATEQAFASVGKTPPEDRGDAYEGPVPITPEMVKRIEGMLGQLKLDWSMTTTKQRAGRVVGRTVENLSELTDTEGAKLMKALFKLLTNTAADSLMKQTEPATA
jgi:hypothetical protein